MRVKELLSVSAALFLAAAAHAAPRPPAVAGKFYPEQPKDIAAMVDGFLAAASTSALSGRLVALLVPHAGLVYSGPTAARGFLALKGGRWDAVIIVGTGHYKDVEGAAIYPGAYSTPEGSIPYDEALAKALVKASSLIVLDGSAHEREHSIEVELPFLRRTAGKAKLVAMLMNTDDLEKARAVGHALALAAKGRRILLIASSDQSHYPPADVAAVVDDTTIEALKRLSPDYFWLANRLLGGRGLPNLVVTYCGKAAVTAVMTAAVELGANAVDVLGRANSSAAAGDKTRVVGYAAAAFVEAKHPAAAADLSAEERAALLTVARGSIEAQLKDGRTPRLGLFIRPRLNLPAAVFVTLRVKAGGALRGCVGSTRPEESLVEAVEHMAAAAAVSDRRFPPVTLDELGKLTLEISVLSPTKSVADADEVKSGDGVVLGRDGKIGVFLPSVWDELKERSLFFGELCAQKAGLERNCWQDAKTRFETFSVESFTE